ncbi:hypothetical protein PLESTB_000216600 [Pleodorina starrii]|uniref:Uncharacterized protein n=1 Tax=Pleodorina starrii TaxID=330485 RepID=A0A9W6BCB3_9CHLO|nr:hypothetical protein PLESTM_001542200 [Pleodorina starrii]GLC49413.1 hypothetical protein PLESTB_000216600 [Pleodorina starrii]
MGRPADGNHVSGDWTGRMVVMTARGRRSAAVQGGGALLVLVLVLVLGGDATVGRDVEAWRWGAVRGAGGHRRQQLLPLLLFEPWKMWEGVGMGRPVPTCHPTCGGMVRGGLRPPNVQR